ncbi:riboflavin kinase (NB-ARC domain protein) [Botrytis cinerea]
MTNALTEMTETSPTVIYLGRYDATTTHFNEMGTQFSAYSETPRSPRPHDGANPSQVWRKPVAPQQSTATPSGSDIDNLTKYGRNPPEDNKAGNHSNSYAAQTVTSQSQTAPIQVADFETLQIPQTRTNIERTISAPAAPLNVPAFHDLPKFANETSEPSSYVSKAFQEARHFAGGLITHPSESTKHFSILRHSHGLVFYQGCSTTLAVSIFSDAPLPPDRQVWLQDKGWSGNTGMRLKAFVGNNASWIKVTPTIPISAEQLKESDERAWQRDIKNPVFRILSASASPSSMRGASLSTLPLEIGAMAMTVYANKTIGGLVSPVTSTAMKVAQPFMPSKTRKEAAVALYGKSGTEEMVKSTITNGNIQYKGVRSFSYNQAGSGDNESGPRAPYPICFIARSEIEIKEGDYFSMPTMTLSGIAEHISHQLRGHYFAWVRRRLDKGAPRLDTDIWSQTVISSLPMHPSNLHKATIVEASKRIFKIHFISDCFESQVYDMKNLEIKVMGFIRPDAHPVSSNEIEEELVASLNDIIFAQSILDQPVFAPEIEGEGQGRGLLERATTGYADVRLRAQREMDRVPLHRMGLRMEVDRLRDEGVGLNGFYVVR